MRESMAELSVQSIFDAFDLMEHFNEKSADRIREEEDRVDMYEDKYYATLLLPAGITSLASIMYKDEEKLLASGEDADKVYIETILPEKMKYNLDYTEHFGFGSDIKLMFKTVKEVIS